MKKLIFTAVLLWGTGTLPEDIPIAENSLHRLTPNGYIVTDKIYGDLNGDNKEDVVLLIKESHKGKLPDNKRITEVRSNRRGVIVAFRSQQKYETATKNLNCFSSESEDGGTYFPPDLDIRIEKGNLHFHYLHGRYGYWSYSFRNRDNDFELIGYEHSLHRGPTVISVTSINFLTQKKLLKENIGEGHEERFKETWSSFTLDKRIRLSEIHSFDSLDIEALINSNN
ncbi:hypothetical protein ACJJIF_02170 [Microbulbifer sp. SSSA002]|uniref:hypothetical protein n=1 Tax=Microbulbifer sp. SSSA002 TaxID=3243376 RepID=UPI00403A0E12